MSPAGPRYSLEPDSVGKRWGIKFLFGHGKGRAKDIFLCMIFVDTPVLRFDIGKCAQGWKFRKYKCRCSDRALKTKGE